MHGRRMTAAVAQFLPYDMKFLLRMSVKLYAVIRIAPYRFSWASLATDSGVKSGTKAPAGFNQKIHEGSRGELTITNVRFSLIAVMGARQVALYQKRTMHTLRYANQH